MPTIGGNISSGNDILLQGAWNQKGGPHVWNFPEPVPISSRNDVVVFQTEPLADDLEVTGEIEVRLFASSSAVDTDFTAKLIDVYPPSARLARRVRLEHRRRHRPGPLPRRPASRKS